MECKGNDHDAPKFHSEHVKEEFYKWFESQGLLSNLRAYMRQLMVKALEKANKNGKTVQQRKAITSPKLQAINLLLIDYLFHGDYLYTVSVFASEAEILESLPQYSSYMTQTVRERHWEPGSLPRFSQQEAEDILDTLRLLPTRQGAMQASQLYMTGEESLLTCVVRTLAFLSGMHQDFEMTENLPDEKNGVECSVDYGRQLWSQEIEELLLLAGVKLQHIRCMQHKWTQIIEEEKMIVRQEEAVHRTTWKQEMEELVREEMVEQLREWQSRVELREKGLSTLAEQLTTVHHDINDRLCQLQSQREELLAKEEQLEVRLSQLQLKSAITSFQEQTDVTTVLQEKQDQKIMSKIESKTTSDICVQVSPSEMQPVVTVHTQTANPAVAVCTQTVDSVDQEQQTSQCIVPNPRLQIANPAVAVCTQTVDSVDQEQQCQSSAPDHQLLLQLQIEREKISELQEENLELRAHVLQQRYRIDDLTNRAASLSNQLEESQIALALLRGQEESAVEAAPPPSTPAFIVPTFGFNNPQRKGAGEESLLTPRTQQTISRPTSRRRPIRFAFSQNQNPTSEESSPTDEIIQNARSRIQQLDEESAAAQRNYHAFQARLMSSDSVMFPPLGSSLRTHNIPLRMGTNNIMPLLSFSHRPHPPNSYNLRSTFRPNEYNEDSSSDQTSYETSRIDKLTNTRRMFNQRNIRQFERWKQFKKKFQRRDTLEESRRKVYIAQSSTSSDDDCDSRKATSRQKTIKHNLHTVQQDEFQIPKENKQDRSKCMVNNESEANSLLTMVPLNKENTLHSEREVNASKLETLENKPRLCIDDKKSVKLIESVKILLQDKCGNPTSTLSNGSLAVESLPRDSHNGSDNSSLLTVQRLLSEAKIDTVNKRDSDGNNFVTLPNSNLDPKIVSVYNTNFKPLVNDCLTEKKTILEEIDQRNLDFEDVPVPLSIPTPRLFSQNSNTANKVLGTVAITSSDIAEHESGDRSTASVSSGSDILRELNPSKTESSESVISTGIADVSKHSSDFWD